MANKTYRVWVKRNYVALKCGSITILEVEKTKRSDGKYCVWGFNWPLQYVSRDRVLEALSFLISGHSWEQSGRKMYVTNSDLLFIKESEFYSSGKYITSLYTDLHVGVLQRFAKAAQKLLG